MKYFKFKKWEIHFVSAALEKFLKKIRGDFL
jgi:hypothetical protein